MVQYTLPSNQCNYSRQFKDKNKMRKGPIGFQTQSMTFVLITVIDLTSVQSPPRSVIMLHREQEIILVGLILDNLSNSPRYQYQLSSKSSEVWVPDLWAPPPSFQVLVTSKNFFLLIFQPQGNRCSLQLLFALLQHSLISSFLVLQYSLHKLLILDDLC